VESIGENVREGQGPQYLNPIMRSVHSVLWYITKNVTFFK